MRITDEYIKFEKKDRWVVIILNHPPVNSLNIPLMDQLTEKLDEIEKDEKIQAVIITGVGNFFAAGGDIQELEEVKTSSEGKRLSAYIHETFNKIELFPKPIVAAINGVCFGGGLELALACHIRIADEEAKLGLPEIKLGLIPGGGGTQRLPQLVGRSKAYEMILTGEAIDSREAYRIGLVNSVSPKGECLAYSERIVEKISQKAPSAVAAAVESIQWSQRGDKEGGLKRETQIFGLLCENPQKTESIKAFLEKRKPAPDQ